MSGNNDRVVLNLLLSILTSHPPSNPRDFYNALRKVRTKVDLRSLRTERGFTLFHETIARRRSELLPAFQQVGVFASLYYTPVSPGVSEYAEMTPTELALHCGAHKERAVMEHLLKMERSLERDLMKQACRGGQVERFSQLVATDPHKVVVPVDNMTCLDWAITSGSKEMVQAVIATEHKIQHKRTSGDNPIVLVVTLGHVHLLNPIRLHTPVDLNSVRVDGKSLLEKTAEFGDWEMFVALRDAGAVTSDAVLLAASAAGKVTFVQRLTCLLPEINVNVRDERHRTPLHVAVQNGHEPMVAFLLQQRPDLLLQDKRGRNALHLSAEHGNLEIMNLIIHSALDRGCLRDLQTARDKYLGSELCFLVRGRDRDRSAWHYVQVDRAFLEIFRTKTRGGAVDVARFGTVIRSGWGASPSADVTREIEAPYDAMNVRADAEADMTPLHLAVLKNNHACALRLIELVEDVNIPDSLGLTPLHLACMRGDVTVVQALADKGADRTAKDNKDRSPLAVAESNEHGDLFHSIPNSILDATEVFLQTQVMPLLHKLSRLELEKRNTLGNNVAQFIKTTLRDLQGDINGFLYDQLRSGPVVQQSGGG